MTCNLEKNKGVSVKSLPLGGEGASLQFVTLAGSEPGQLAEHAELLQKLKKTVSGGLARKCMAALIWISPGARGGDDCLFGYENGRILLSRYANLRGGGGKCPGD